MEKYHCQDGRERPCSVPTRARQSNSGWVEGTGMTPPAQMCISLPDSPSHPEPRERREQWSWVGTWTNYHCNFKSLLCPIPNMIWELRVTSENLSVLTLDVEKSKPKISIHYRHYYPQRTKGRPRNEWQGCASFAPVKLCTSHGVTYRMTAHRRHRDRPFTLAGPLRLMTLEVFLVICRGPCGTWKCVYRDFHSAIHVYGGVPVHAETPRCVLGTKWKRQSKERKQRKSSHLLHGEKTPMSVS